ncbi:flavin monoamine oxidase family protein [Rhodococcus sp. LB1]|uniref:flavin monoamine oxidase family protein n=1 Tax=Rhodococcus sp. LB1 TaxID=1807499 RepID=UPI00077AA988|nr:flavin monoamine oxidase family protein [Rhodococcus sp. LB1]KXX58795.1 hypothetical protein AZG88_08035 [Rhodococcus sp. LB1]
MTVTSHSERSPRDVDVVVVGAGLSGLSAAREAMRAGLSVLVIEARDRVGGRTWNRPLPDGTPIEAGGQWIGPHQRYIRALVSELGLETYPTFQTGYELREIDGTLCRFESDVDSWAPDEAEDIGRSITELETLAASIDPVSPWGSPNATDLDTITFREWMTKTCRTARGHQFWASVIGGIWGAEVFETSLLHVLIGVRAAGGELAAMTETAGGAQQDRIVGGSQLISTRMAEALGERVLLDSPVRSIEHDDTGVTVVSDRCTARSTHVVVTVPPTLAARIQFCPPLSTRRDQLMQRLPLCNYTKVNVVYPKPFWREDGLSGGSMGTTGPFAMTFDNTPPDCEVGVLVGFVEGNEAIRFGCLPSSERRHAVVSQLVALFGQAAANVTDIVETDWTKEIWSRGAHQSLFGPGTWTTYGPHVRLPEGRIHWAGAETATEWMCYMDGAVSSGIRAVQEILAKSVM